MHYVLCIAKYTITSSSIFHHEGETTHIPLKLTMRECRKKMTYSTLEMFVVDESDVTEVKSGVAYGLVNADNRFLIAKILKPLIHRGPDSPGLFHFPIYNLSLLR